MTIVLCSFDYGNITIQKYYEKFTVCAFWRIIKEGRILRKGLLNKPNKEQINNYLYNY